MRFLKIKSISFILICIYIFLSDFGFAGIVKKEPYSIQPKIKYKDSLNIAIMPFTGELSEERKYVKDLIKNYLGDNILLYKKIRFPYSFIDFKANSFNSSGKELNKTEKINNEMAKNEEIKARFLELKLLEDIDKKINNVDSSESIFLPGTDIVITGGLIQEINNIKVRIKVINNIYGKTFNIEKVGSFKNIDQLMGSLLNEVLKVIIVRFSYLNISSNEKEAAIYIDDRFFGRTDKSGILLESGTHKVTVIKDNFPEWISVINIAERSTESLNVKFNSKDTYTKNSIEITTEPDKAKIYFDSDFIGLSPIVKNDLQNGMYRVRIEKEGYITKYQTIEFNDEKESKKDLSVTLEKGDSKEYYFSRTSAYNNLFICSSFGIVISAASYLYFGLKVNDQNAKLDNISDTDPNKSKIQDRKDKYKLYQQISLYTLGAMIISAGVFYYLDKAQDDIDIAFYLPQVNYYTNKATTSSSYSLSSMEKGIGIVFIKSF